MSQFVISYFGGDTPSTPEEGQQHFAKYKKWLSDLGDAVVSPMNPLKNTVTLTKDNQTSGSHTGMSGYTIVEADNIEQALEMAKTCPFIDINGTLEVAEKINMQM